jgi:N,N'-diacetyllegionaminate synthase
MKIGSREISSAHEPYVIAELGVNHDGSVDRALLLVDAAKAAGANAIKLQFFRARLLLSSSAALATYQAAAGERSPMEMLARLELEPADLGRIATHAHAVGLHAIVTVFSVPLLAEAETIAWDAYKVASPDVVHDPLLDALATTKRPMILSTGAATVEEITRAVERLTGAHERLGVLQCVSSYPTSAEHASLAGIAALRGALPDRTPIGYSDHTVGEHTGALAVAAGACVLEKHLTYDRAAVGPDHSASLDARGFARYVAAAREAFAMLGPPGKRVLACEQDVRRLSRQSLTAARALPAGHALTLDDLCIKRPGTGLAPEHLMSVVGRRLRRAVPADVVLTADDLS